MTTTPTETGAAPAPMGLVSRFIGIITSPKATFETVVAHPKWLGMLLLTALAVGFLVGGFLITKVGQDAWLYTLAQGRFGRPTPPEQMAAMERIAPFVGYIAIAQMLIFMPIIYVITAGILYAVFTIMMGGNATFKQVFAVVVHTGPIGVLQQLFTVPMNFAQQSLTSKTNLAVFLPAAEGTFLGSLLGAIDLFLIWQLIVLAIGLGVLFRRRTQPIATSLFVIYGVIALIIAAAMKAFGGSN